MSSPFNETKYKVLLEGLEISIKRLSEIRTDNPTLRYDSEYFKKEYLEIFSTLYRNDCKKMSTLSSLVTQGPNPNFDENGEIPCLTGRNINKGTVNYNDPDFVNNSEYESLKRFQLKKGDTLITLKGKGSIGKIGYVRDERKAIFSRNIGVIRPKGIDSGFLNAFILSNYGKKILERGETGGTGQSTLTTEYLKNIDIPRFSIEKEIGNLIKISEQVLQNSQSAYRQAEIILLEAIGLKKFQPSTDPINVKGFKESFLSTSRLDAEYYQKKYEDYLKLIQSYSNGFGLLSTICNLKDNNYNPEDNKEYKYIELADVGKTGDITGFINAKGIELPTRARRFVKTDDVVISSIEGSLESCALVTEEYNNTLCSTGFYVINSKQINAETLLVLFKSEPMQNILKQNCSGTILTAINKSEFQNIPIPLIKIDLQKQIKDKIYESFKLKKQSEQLLKTVKTAVEIAIEENEENALVHIQENIKLYGSK